MKKVILFFISIFILSKSVFALQITEIMYDPAGSDTGNEWIEVYNDSGAAITLTSYKFFENNVNHSISANIGGPIINDGEYAIIADNTTNFLNAHSSYTGKLFDSAFSLSNSGEYLELRDNSGANLFSVTYTINSLSDGTGGTLNYASSSWQVFVESPGYKTTEVIIVPAVNSGSTSNSSTTSETSSSTNTTSSNSNVSSNNYAPGYTSRTYVLGDLDMLTPKEIHTVVGADTRFFVKPIDARKNTVPTNTYWSFGDGAEGYGATTSHRYYNPGVYTAFVESEVSNAYGIEQIRVTVNNPDVHISDVGEGYVSIKNRSDQELNIGGFIISSDLGFFKLSRQLILAQGAELKIDGRIFNFTKLTNVKILTPYMNVISEYKGNYQNIVNDVKQSSVLSLASSSSLKTASSSPILKVSIATTTLNKKIISKKPIVKKTVVKVATNKNTVNIVNVASTTKKDLKKEEVKIKQDISTTSLNSSPAIALDQSREIKKEVTLATTTDISKTVYISPIKKEKNWLYWLYE